MRLTICFMVYLFLIAPFPDLCLLVLVWFFPTSVFGVGIFFLIALFPDLCLLVPFYDVLKMLTDDAIFIAIRNNADLKIKIESHVLQIARPL